MKNIFLLLIVLFLFQVQESNAQSSSIKTMDLAVYVITTDTTVSDSVKLKLQFKIDNPGNASKVYCWLGTGKDDATHYVATPLFVKSGGLDYLAFKNSKIMIENRTASIVLTVSKQQYKDFSTATVYVEDKTAKTTSRLYYKK